MKKFGPKKIEMSDVVNADLYFSNIIQKTTMTSIQKKIDELYRDESLKEISQKMDQVLMILGTTGLQLLSNVFRSTEDYLTNDDFYDVYSLCDGFGKKNKEELLQINGGYDWSHIRDSSEEALKEAVTLTQKKLIELYNKS